MKNPRSVIVVLSLGFLILGIVTGCKKSESASVDIGAAREQLKSSDPAAQQNGCIELAKAGPDAAPAIPELLPLLKDKDPLTRRLAAYALGQIGPAAKEAVPALKELMNDSDRDVVASSVNALNAIDPSATGGATLPSVSN
jgi:HEAT repeat protein